MSDIISIIPKGKIKCYLTGKERKETPEEKVRQAWLQRLVEEYGYPREQIEVEFSIKSGSNLVRVDIAVFYTNKEHIQENIFIIIETKKEDIKSSDRDNGIEQLKSYMSICLNCEYGLWVGQEKQAFEVVEKDGLKKHEVINDIPLADEEKRDKFTFDNLLEPVEGLRATFKRCHNYIYMNQGLQKEHAFREFLKIIFCKVYDETESDPINLQFYISNIERKTNKGKNSAKKRIEKLFDCVKNKYPHIFNNNEQINVEPRVLAYIVGELQRYSFLKADTDIKGEAYEEIVGSNLRGDKGEFFTPRNICDLAIEFVFSTFDKNKLKDLRILDPACGTGGFLVTALNKIKDELFEGNIKRFNGNYTEAIYLTRENIRNICDKNFFGMDFNPFLVSACQMNMVMNGDGSSNIFHQNSLLPLNDYKTEYQKHIRKDFFDVVITNPPFGNDPSKGTFIDDRHILNEFKLASGRNAVPAEQLFIERCLYFLKPGGVLAIVLPDNILSNPGLQFIREWILEVGMIIAIVDLPTETFEPHTGVQTSVVVIKKKNNNEIKLWKRGIKDNYPIFMAIADKIGHDRRGNKLFRRLPTGEEIIEIVEKQVKVRKYGQIVFSKTTSMERVLDDDIPDIIKVFKEYWLTNNGRWAIYE